MFGKKRPEDIQLQEAIDRLHACLKNADPDTEEYTKLLTAIERLEALKPPKRARGISPDALWGGVVQVFSVGLVIGHERANVITTKALDIIKKSKPS